MKNSTVILTGGGTAGHITPLIAVAKELNKNYPEVNIIYIGQRGDKNESVIVKSGLPIKVIKIYAGKYRRFPTLSVFQRIFGVKRHLLNLRDVLYTTLGFVQSIFIIISTRPRAVFMKGGYVGVPVGLAAGLLRKRLITHDSDVLPGLANKIVSPFATIHAVATKSSYSYPENKTVVTGIPVRDEYYEYAGLEGRDRARKELGFSEDSLILFIGGSTQGAKEIDDIIEELAPELLNEFPKLHIVQVFGRLNEDALSSRYKNLGDNLRNRLHLHGFLHDNYRYMAASDVLVGRAGATFIAEASVLASACVIIPASHLTGGHQVENAKVLESLGATKVITEERLSAEYAKEVITGLLKSKDARLKLGTALHQSEKTNSAKEIANLIMGS